LIHFYKREKHKLEIFLIYLILESEE
jgi:hypothetical protein